MSKDIINIRIPKKPNYISLVRLTTSSIAYNAGLNVDEIEDIKVSIAEACINALSFNKREEIDIEFEVETDKLIIKVKDVLENIPNQIDEGKERDLGLLIIKSLMDEVEFTEEGITMIKYTEDGNQ